MTVEAEAAAESGAENTFDKEFEAARVDAAPGDAAAVAEADAADAEGQEKTADELKGEPKAPLTPEELQRRLSDQQGATRQERQRRRELERTVSEMREQVERLSQGRAAPTGEQAQRPDPTEDPIGYLEYVEGMLQGSEKERSELERVQAVQRQAAEQVQQVVTRVADFEADFRETHTDYDKAAEHLYEVKKSEYVENGYSADEAHHAVMQEFLTRAQRAFAANKDPAEIIYSLSKRAGFNDNAGAKKLDAIAEGQRRSNPMAGAGASGGSELSLENVSKLKGAAFDTAFAKLQSRAKQIERETGL